MDTTTGDRQASGGNDDADPGSIRAYPTPSAACCARARTPCGGDAGQGVRALRRRQRWTYRQTRDRAPDCAPAALGVKQGDHVLTWLPNGPDALRVWLRSIISAPSTCRSTSPIAASCSSMSSRIPMRRLIVVHADLRPRSTMIDRAALTHGVVLGRRRASASRAARFMRGRARRRQRRAGRRWSGRSSRGTPRCIIYTSGTTGPSKGVLSSYLHLYTMAPSRSARSTADDRF